MQVKENASHLYLSWLITTFRETEMRLEGSKNWTETELGNVAVAVTGWTYEKSDTGYDNLSPIITIDEIFENSILLSDEKYARISSREQIKFGFRKGDIVFNFRTNLNQLGKTAVFDLDCLVIHTSKYFKIRPIDGYDSRYLNFLFRLYKQEGRFGKIATHTSKLACISLTQLKSLKVPFLPLDKQKRIVGIVDEGFKKLNQLENHLNSLGNAIATYFRYVADLAVGGQLIGYEGFENHQLGDCLVHMNTGFGNKSETGVSVPSIRKLSVGLSLNSSVGTRMVELDETEFRKLKLSENDILIQRSSSELKDIGESFLTPESHTGFVYPGSFIRLRTTELLDPHYLNIIMQSSMIRSRIQHSAHFAGKVYKVGLQEIADIHIPLPAMEHQLAVVSETQALHSRITGLSEEYLQLKIDMLALPEIILARGLWCEESVDIDNHHAAELLNRVVAELEEVRERYLAEFAMDES
jgi:restriction endonuclease S subunit